MIFENLWKVQSSRWVLIIDYMARRGKKTNWSQCAVQWGSWTLIAAMKWVSHNKTRQNSEIYQEFNCRNVVTYHRRFLLLCGKYGLIIQRDQSRDLHQISGKKSLFTRINQGWKGLKTYLSNCYSSLFLLPFINVIISLSYPPHTNIWQCKI